MQVNTLTPLSLRDQRTRLCRCYIGMNNEKLHCIGLPVHINTPSVNRSSQYLERFQVDLLHRQPAVFCEELHTGRPRLENGKPRHRDTLLMLSFTLMKPTCRCCRSSSCMFWERLYTWKENENKQTHNTCQGAYSYIFSIMCACVVLHTPAQSWSLCWGRTQWHSPLWWTGCRMLPGCQLAARQPVGRRQLHETCLFYGYFSISLFLK